VFACAWRLRVVLEPSHSAAPRPNVRFMYVCMCVYMYVVYVCMYVCVCIIFIYIYSERFRNIFGNPGCLPKDILCLFLVCVRARELRVCACVLVPSPKSLPYPHIPCVCFLCVCVCVCVSVCEIPYVSFLHAHHTTSATWRGVLATTHFVNRLTYALLR
jgi:hypothetical protein